MTHILIGIFLCASVSSSCQPCDEENLAQFNVIEKAFKKREQIQARGI
jgi:hypothetical protein